MTTEQTTRVNVYYTGTYGGIAALAETVGANCVSSVDHCNSDGTGVACLDVPTDAVDSLISEMAHFEGVESYKVRG